MLFLLDSSAVLNDFGFSFSQQDTYMTTPLVFAELLDMRSRHLAENALQQGLLRLAEPSPESLESAKKKIYEKGFTRLSAADISLLALGLGKKKEKQKFVLVTDDYSIQNFCRLLGLPFESVIRGRISKPISFRLFCPGCGFTPAQGPKERGKTPCFQDLPGPAGKAKRCPACGTPMKGKKAECANL